VSEEVVAVLLETRNVHLLSYLILWTAVVVESGRGGSRCNQRIKPHAMHLDAESCADSAREPLSVAAMKNGRCRMHAYQTTPPQMKEQLPPWTAAASLHRSQFWG
jgi:hypothetical protein